MFLFEKMLIHPLDCAQHVVGLPGEVLLQPLAAQHLNTYAGRLYLGGELVDPGDQFLACHTMLLSTMKSTSLVRCGSPISASNLSSAARYSRA